MKAHVVKKFSQRNISKPPQHKTTNWREEILVVLILQMNFQYNVSLSSVKKDEDSTDLQPVLEQHWISARQFAKTR